MPMVAALSLRMALRIFIGWSILATVLATNSARQDGHHLAARGRHGDYWEHHQALVARQDEDVDEPAEGGEDGDDEQEMPDTPPVPVVPAVPIDEAPATTTASSTNAIPTNPPPSEDEWYRPPEGWELEPVGAVLKTRPEGLPACMIKYCKDTYQYMYRTSDTHLNASWSVATVFVPEGVQAGCETDPDTCSQGVVTYTIPYDSASPDAVPSYLVQWGDPYGEMADMMKRGWFVLGPDYEGPKAAFCDGPQSAYGTLDSMRAIKEVGHEFGLRVETAKYAIWGYSGGAFASGYAAEMAEGYAPELDIAGALIGGPSPNLTTALINMNGEETAGLVVAGLIGITAQWPEQRQWMLDHMHKEGEFNTSGFMVAWYYPAIVVLYRYADHDVFKYFINGIDDVLSPPIRDLLDDEGQMGIHGIPNMLTFVYKAGEDEMSPIEETDAMVETFCEGGANILYHRNSIGSHNQELWSGRPRALLFLETVLDGTDKIEVPETGCLTVNVSIGLPNFTTIEIGSRFDLETGLQIDRNGNPIDTSGNQVGDGAATPPEEAGEEADEEEEDGE